MKKARVIYNPTSGKELLEKKFGGYPAGIRRSRI